MCYLHYKIGKNYYFMERQQIQYYCEILFFQGKNPEANSIINNNMVLAADSIFNNLTHFCSETERHQKYSPNPSHFFFNNIAYTPTNSLTLLICLPNQGEFEYPLLRMFFKRPTNMALVLLT